MTDDALRLLVFKDVETATDDPDRLGRPAGAVDALRTDRTAVLDAGDSTAMGALAFSTDRGRGHTGAFHRALAPDAHVPGNHDLDHGPVWLAGFAAGTPGRWLGANVDGGDHLALADHLTLDLDGRTVGVVGVANPETADICAAAEPLDFGDPVDAAADSARDLRDAGADHVVVLSHCGTGDAELAREVDADAVLGGHDHDRVVERVDGTLVARTAGVGRELLAVELGDRATATVHETAEYPAADGVTETYRARVAEAGLDDRVATLSAPLSARDTARAVAEAYRMRAETPEGDRGVDAGFVVEASVREPLSGDVTTGDLLGTVPFESTLVTVELSAASFRAALAATETPIDATHGRGIWAGADPETESLDGDPVDGPVTVGAMSYAAATEVVPGFTEEAVVADAGPQYEQVLTYARRRGLDTDA